MRKFFIGLFFSWIVLMSYGLILSQHDLTPTQTKEQVASSGESKYYDYKGVTHAMSSEGRGSRTLDEIFTIAKLSNLDFIFITNANTYERGDQTDISSNGTSLFVAGKYSYVDAHIIALGGEKVHKFKSIGQTQILLNDLLTQRHRSPANMSLILTHPLRERYKWTGAYPIGLNGIEVVNLKQLWRKKANEYRFNFLLNMILYPFNSSLAFINIIDIPKDEIILWDELNLEKSVVGFLGNNTTAKAIIFPSDDGFIRFPSYQVSFGLASNHLLLRSELTGILERDKNKILSALKVGQFYMAFDILGNTRGFYTEIISGKNSFLTGEDIKVASGMKLRVHLPYLPDFPLEIRLFRDGRLYSTSNQKEVDFQVNGPGAYRVEVMVKPKMPIFQNTEWTPWIYSNHFHVKD